MLSEGVWSRDRGCVCSLCLLSVCVRGLKFYAKSPASVIGVPYKNEEVGKFKRI